MNVRYGIPVLFICCGFFTLLINIFGSRPHLKKLKPHYGVVNQISDSSKLLDLRNFKYEISTECYASHLIWIVTSFAGDASERSALRRAYTSEELSNLGIQRVFLLGILDENSQKKTGISQSALENESRRFRDLVQGNFIEAYRNLTYKHLMGLKWSAENCDHVPYIMKMDDDIIVNLYEVLDKLEDIKINNSLVGYVLENQKPIRRPFNKWFVTKDEYLPDIYPRFVSGWLYVTTPSVISRLIDRANSYPKYFWIDDAFITGILREEANVQLIDIKNMYASDYRFLKCCIEGGKKNLKCEFSIGPNGGLADLQIRFKEFADSCKLKCDQRPKELAVAKTCVVALNEESLGEGTAQIRPINIK